MDDLIRRQAAIYALGKAPQVWRGDDLYAVGVRQQYNRDRLAIENLPSAQPERKEGKWLEKKVIPVYENGFSLQSCKCSECGRYDTSPYMYYFSEPNFCSYCGARMGKGESDDKR